MIGLNGKLSILVLAFGCVSAFAQNTNAPVAGSPGCGDFKVKFDVKTAGQQASSKPDAGEALVYIIQDDSDYNSTPKRLTRMGLDGRWVGAMHGDSFFAFNIAPGSHHLCASWQSSSRLSAIPSRTEAKSFTAQAGGVYYFVVKNTFLLQDNTPPVMGMDLKQVDSDQGQLLANSRSVSTAKQK